MQQPENTITAAEALDLIESTLQLTISDLEKAEKIAGFCLQIPDLYGCTDKNAANYNRFAKYNDGSCQYYAATPPEE